MSSERKIFVCPNDEFICDGPLSDCDTEGEEGDAAAEWVDLVVDAIESLGHSAECPHDELQTYHGWNGARFARTACRGGVGTYDQFSDVEWDAIEAAVEAATSKLEQKMEHETEAEEI